ncbi:unnamed protein product [Penicillium egyptiacum]|uniref:Uncharacterized protein n=1 Tax=Penicillium egyptiacum TaxID=1303716 RepID=A0A9W4KC04_9EURO|nr:unnamed protein product [Penicillium egyptiacum]
MDDSAPVVAGILGYPDTASFFRLISTDCPDTRQIIIDLFRDRDNKFGFADSAEVPPGLRSIRNSMVIIAFNHSAKYSAALLAESACLSTPHFEPGDVFDLRTLWYVRRLLLSRAQDLGRQSQVLTTPFNFEAKETLICWKILVYFARRMAKAKSIDAYLSSTPHVRVALKPELTTSRSLAPGSISLLSPGHGTSAESHDDIQAPPGRS